MLHKVLRTIRENAMFNEGDKVIVAVSGGPDSICLLRVLYELKDKLKIELAVAHLNHNIRGKAADEDAEYVRQFCLNLKIDFFIKKVDVNGLSREKGISSEMAGREARYKFFNDLKQQINADKIAIAHNANDQAETVLMRIMRGTGIEGLVGIRPVRDNIYVRPLIKVKRDDIEDYCRKNELNPRIDKTNLENIYRRNKIRLELIPYIKENFNSDIIMTLNRLSDTLKIDYEYMESISLEKYKLYCKEKQKKVTISKEAFLEHEAIVTRIIRKALSYITGSTYNFEKKHILDIIKAQKGKTGTFVSLPQNIEVCNNYGDLSIYNNTCKTKKDILEYELDYHKINVVGKNKIIFRIIENNQMMNFHENKFTRYFSYDDIKGKVTLRYRKNGDRFNPIGINGTKKLKDIFIDMKIERDLRDKIPLICFDNEIAWIVGHKMSNKFTIKENTRQILEIKYEGEEV
ncbi:tRNA(Ile)-lysidine synthase [Clostridium acidisoli DSM 12555]|uniref:tRNA(Ile)-lysidine synthase n=1 Tax=Clostridium acidisoli DSM 12555 TaxID=1121291 RepID=A0A1W1XZM3_9CLOT|nr:tRNA lysidine(34) synthetase TilS [Clostridium acidisoli]SMC28981.1 tRNA(Ile)-lysidine synthase [Clostridium acidisoli DSM 12555]